MGLYDAVRKEKPRRRFHPLWAAALVFAVALVTVLGLTEGVEYTVTTTSGGSATATASSLSAGTGAGPGDGDSIAGPGGAPDGRVGASSAGDRAAG